MTKEDLNAAFDRYLRGERPTKAEIAAAPRILNWRVVISETILGVAHEMRLRGTVTGHPDLPAGETTTSPLIWIDQVHNLAHTMSRLYALGDPA